MAKESSQQAVLVDRLRSASKGGRLGGSTGVLFALVHLFLELLGFLFVDEAQSGEAVLQLESVKEGTVLAVAPRIEDFLIPNDAAIGGLRTTAVMISEPLL